MKICILTTIYPKYEGNSNGIFVHRLAKAFRKIGLETHVVTPHAEGLSKEVMMSSVYVHRFQYMYPAYLQTLAYFPGIPENIKRYFNKMQVPFFVISMFKKLCEIIKKYNIDLINAHWGLPSGLIAVMSKSIYRVPVVTTLYGAELYISKSRYSIFRSFLKRAISNSDSVVAISDETRRVAWELTGREDIKIIPDGVDTDFYSPLNDGSEIKERLKLSEHKVIFSCGRMVERKGFEYLIRAMQIVIKEFPKTKLILVGEGPEKSKLMKIALNLGINEDIIFPGIVSEEDLAKYYAACDIFILPSIIDSRGDTEGSGTTLVEAMATGKPVIGTKVGGIPYALRDMEGGFLVEQKNPWQLAEKIIILLRDENLRKELGRRGRRVAEERFSWDKIAERYLEEFRRL
jgi:glycosyltransferase involved in cell wall biosynthesis